jgi:hypothetical protein
VRIFETSYQRALLDTVTFIKGPAGTRKAHNISVILLTLSISECGIIMVCATSNEASDGVADCIAGLNQLVDLRRKILRVFATSREHQQIQLCTSFKNLDNRSETQVLISSRGS